MSLKNELARSGALLFRRRSYLPLLILPLFVLALAKYHNLLGSEALDGAWEVGCLIVSALGLAVRILTVGHVPKFTSGRNTERQEAAVLNTTGMYSIVRHPLYLGNFLVWLGIALFAHTWWLVVITMLAYWIYYERICYAEEEFLRASFGAEFEAWASRTPSFVPAVRLWKPPALAFSWKFVLARENSTVFATIVTFFTLEIISNFFEGKMPDIDIGWVVLLASGSIAYVVLRALKKSKLLAVTER